MFKNLLVWQCSSLWRL